MPRKHNMTAQSHYLEQIKGKLLDNFLAKGWYRMGPSIFTSHFIHNNNELFSTIWLRTVMEGYTYSKSLRKIRKKNKAQFTKVIESYSETQDIKDLYQAYKTIFKGTLPETLSQYMIDSLDKGIYDTRLVKVYDGDQLIACSIFDVGKDSIASIFAFYDPAYQASSLGLYTMLLEVEFCEANELTHYYMGYFVPGNTRFDYKLRIGHLEYWDYRTEEWHPIDQYDANKIPIEQIKKKLSQLKSVLAEQWKTNLYKNAFIDAHIIEYFPMNYLEYPMLLFFENLELELEDSEMIIGAYDYKADHYKILLCQALHPSFSNYNPEWLATLDDHIVKQEFVISKTLKSCKTIAPILRWLAKENNSSQNPIS